jgi:hypothetical protein
MNLSDDIMNELKETCPLLASHARINVFSVPDGYFSELAERLMTYSLLNTVEEIDFGKVETMRVPDGYFESLSSNILAKIKSQSEEQINNESEELSHLLFSLKDKNVFSVPENYFENLSDTILNNLNLNKKSAKIISMSRARSFWKYAAAAVVTGAIAVSSLQIFNSSPDMKKNNSVVTESSGLPDYIQSSFQYKTPEQVQAGISALSDDAIVKYLQKNGSVLDNEPLTNVNDESTNGLPAETDYLTDDNALNNYLDAINYTDAGKKNP